MDDTCGAKTRAGTPCRQKTIYWNGRCKFHGGLATGPTTDAGKEQSRINGRKGGRPRKDGGETQPHGDGNKGVTREPEKSSVLHAAIATPVQELLQITAIPDAQVSARVLSKVASLAPAPKTEVMDTDKSVFPAQFYGEVLGRVAESEMSNLAHISPRLEQPEISTEKPKSWMLKEAKVLAVCERCTMFAGGGACLAVAKGIIQSMPTGGDCHGFIDFETA